MYSGRQVRALRGHSARVGALAWNSHILSSGSKDNTILNHDVRIQNHVVGKMSTHVQEVCGLSWSPDGTQTLFKIDLTQRLIYCCYSRFY